MDAVPPRLGRALLRRPGAGLAAVVAVIGTALLLDLRMVEWATQARSPVLDALVAVIDPIGSGVTLLAVCVALGLVCRAIRRPRPCQAAWAGSLAFIVAGLIEFGLKYVIGRPRPAVANVFLGPELDSFPSGHATSVFAVATALGSFYPVLLWPLYTLASAIALGRVYLARHYLSDIMAGALIGLAIASLVVWHRNGGAGLPSEQTDAPGRSVQLDTVAVVQVAGDVLDVDHRRQPILAGEDRRVAEDATDLRDQPADDRKDGRQARLDRGQDGDLAGERP